MTTIALVSRSPLALLLATSVTAQTFVVDANGGPGTDYATIAAAVAAVPDGATLQVRAGSYAPFSISAKTLTVVGEAGVVVTLPQGITNAIGVLNLQAGQAVALRGLAFTSSTTFGTATITCSNCQGLVCLQDLRCLGTALSIGRIQATNCDRLLVRDVASEHGWIDCRVVQCHTVLENCRLGYDPSAPAGAESAVSQTGGTLHVVDSTIVGGSGGFLEANAITMIGGDLRLLGAAAIVAGDGLVNSFAVGGTGTLRYAPSVAIGPAAALAPGIVATMVEMPAVTSSFSPVAAATLARMRGPAGVIGALAIALPGPRVVVPLFEDALWVDETSLIWIGLGVLGPGAQVAGSLPWTPGVTPGVTAVWQGVSLDATNGWQLSNPSGIRLP